MELGTLLQAGGLFYRLEREGPAVVYKGTMNVLHESGLSWSRLDNEAA